ncbi:MAG: OB-fold nucleic acid binding domain-containing protein [Planctomycetota bacterium]
MDLLPASVSPQGEIVPVAGMALVRQRPATANGIIFITIEDETGVANLVVHPKTFERHRAVARHDVLLLVRGKVDRAGEVVHVIVNQFESLDEAAAGLRQGSRDLH